MDTLYWNLLVSSSSWTVTVSIGISGRSGPSVSSTSVNHSSFVNCGGMSFISLTRIDAVPVPERKRAYVLRNDGWLAGWLAGARARARVRDGISTVPGKTLKICKTISPSASDCPPSRFMTRRFRNTNFRVNRKRILEAECERRKRDARRVHNR